MSTTLDVPKKYDNALFMHTVSDTNAHFREDPSSLDDTTEELKAGSNDYNLESTANDDSTSTVQKEPVTKTQVALEGQRSGADINEGPDKDKEEERETEVDEKDWDDDIKPVRPEQQPRGRVNPPVSGRPKPKPK
ncbi:hypothetical protein F5876DRAFT_62372 [Lentinula aff. lateritia]|uniref:Uncharacterized protein n=1 Tax=Lentinula aff. lateritia TaxID=2804960 RepID=A0ACC1UC67_9AGAR|nr:hypothetical protein F5876DRAFT_62372 [Lentinula aff. lateritia]